MSPTPLPPDVGSDGSGCPVDAPTLRVAAGCGMDASPPESTACFRAIYEHGLAGIAALAPDGRLLNANPAFCRMLGLSEGELAGRHFDEFLHPDHRQDAESCHRDLANGATEAYEREMRFLRRDGAPLWCRVSVALVRDESGRARQAVAVVQDITERVHAEQQRQRSADHLSEAQRVAHIGSWELDPAQRELWWSDEVFRIFELDAAVSGASYAAFLDRVHPDDRVLVDDFYRESADKRTPYSLEHRLKFADGRVKWVQARGETHYAEAGQVLRSVGTVQDITERRRAEDHLRLAAAVFEQANEGIAVTDATARIVLVNRRFCEVTGYDRSEVIGRNPRMLKSGCHDAFFYQQMWRKLREHGTWSGELWNRRKDGSLYPEFLSIATLCGPEGAVTNYIAVSVDITELKRAEEEMRQLNAELEQRVAARTAELATANADLESFSYSVSHDLRTPLSHIDGFAAIVLDQYAQQLDRQAAQYLTRVREGARRMEHLIDALLALSQAGRARMSVGTVDFSHMAREVAEELRAREPQRQVVLQVAPEVKAWGDAPLLRVVMQNLLSNAWKYTCEREVAHIEVGATRDEHGDTAYFVRDDGAGFDMKFVDKLFKAFERLHSASQFPGTGIGLATVARIIQRHRGRVWAEGEVGKGATFLFALAPGAGEDASAPS
ncbi:MAG: PAS domain S-box protein [Betaproteobacteria bacterium]|nr:PAS domain S-box protein [Betaproteobacteria bacterium]